jgi:hypothetical protein
MWKLMKKMELISGTLKRAMTEKRISRMKGRSQVKKTVRQWWWWQLEMRAEWSGGSRKEW